MNMKRFSLINRNNYLVRTKIVRRNQSNHTSSTENNANNSNEISAIAKNISALFEIETSKSMEITKHLSSSARKELFNLYTKLKSTSNKVGAVVEPQSKDLKIHAFTCGIPFIGFGICDNAILIWAGDVIDQNLGVVFGISTLCAAAIGNIISDIAGVGLGAYIEDFCATKLRLPKANLTNAQRRLRSVRMVRNY